MYVCMLLPQAEGQGAGWPPVRRPLGPVWQPGEREKGAPSAPPELVTIQCPLLTSEKTLKRVEYNCIGGGGSYKGGAVPPTDLRGIAQ